jgi:hypothetical protein
MHLRSTRLRSGPREVVLACAVAGTLGAGRRHTLDYRLGFKANRRSPGKVRVLGGQAGGHTRACVVHPIPLQHGTLLGTQLSAASLRSAEEGMLPAHRHVICGEGASFDGSRPYPTRERKLG